MTERTDAMPARDVVLKDVASVRVADHGYRPVGYHREVYLGSDPDDGGRGVTGLQVGVILTAGRDACSTRSAAPGR
jgi:hypothetical protein